jgi:Protein of unknown function (DUF2800)
MIAHSPTAPSSAHRWMQCPGSVALSSRVGPAPDSPAAALGTAAHAALSWVLADSDREPWELAGMTFAGHEVDAEMLDAVEVGAEVCRSLITPATSVLLDQHISDAKITGFAGTVDFATLTSSLLNVVDYKHGIGVVVECEDNPQMMYYAYGILLKHPTIERVVLRVVQPRAYHPEGPVRRWETSARHIRTWARDELLPAMQRTREAAQFMAGDWCRFCPAKLVCPMMRGLFEAAMQLPTEARTLDNDMLGQAYKLSGPVRMFLRAIEDETLRRLLQGQEIPGTKLVQRRADRRWKEEAEGECARLLGTDAYNPATLKSPAQMEKLGAAAKDLVKQLAYAPDGGYTVALDADRRPSLKPLMGSTVFADLAEAE